LNETGFYKKQVRIALKNSGVIDPEQIGEYIGADGYQALYKALNTPREEVIKIIKDSGLRGRGGGGFPTGLK
jgi:NADH:ubiquinone oxidoreductase subunit F (NADH-binding)